MKKRKIALNGLMLFFLLCICSDSSLLAGARAGSWPAEDRIVSLQDQISALKEQKAQLEAEKQKLMAEGDELSSKIEDLKMQARGGLGIIGRFRLSRSLRKAQALSEKVYALEKKINEIDGELNDKRNELEGEYERQIAALLEKLSQVEQTSDSSLLAGAREERREILEKVKEYQIAKEQLAEPEKKLERLDITKIEIKEYDGPQEIREKADLINDFANKLRNRVDSLNARVGKLQEELKTRERLGEFAEEISFFGERISREEITSDAGKPDVVTSAEEPGERRPVTPGTDTIPKDEGAEMLTEAEPLPERTETLTSTAPDRIVVERNGVSADFVGISLDQIKREIEMLKSQEQALRKELVVLSEKASSFYKKADEIEKSEIEKGEEKR